MIKQVYDALGETGASVGGASEALSEAPGRTPPLSVRSRRSSGVRPPTIARW
jgi:hypothetical protein